MLEFIDSHAHIADPAFDLDRRATIGRAVESGTRAIICVGESIAAAHRAHALAQEYAGVLFSTAGVHPHDASAFDPSRDIDEIRQLVQGGAVAIGECGLDAHYNHSPLERQRLAFASQLALASELDRPVIVHTRDAEEDTRAMVVEAGSAGVRGVLHCFTGSHALAEAALAVGWYVSFSGIVTFKRWTDDALLRLVPADRILVESDAPYLAPVPHRGKRNEPAWVSLTIGRVAEARGVSPSELAQRTSRNAAVLFGLPM
jgi:TatD DNase family protein